MRYQGGKGRQSDSIVELLNSIRQPKQVYLEPFLGSAIIFSKMSLPKIGGDIHEDLVMLMNHIKNGKDLPDIITEDEYNHYRYAVDEPSALRGYIGFGCSFGGKWFGGYAKGNQYNGVIRSYSQECKRSLLKIRESLLGSVMLNVDYTYWNPKNCLIYCDPPYRNTTEYRDSNFDSDLFWKTMREWSKLNTVVISELSAPSDFIPVLRFPKTKGIRMSGDNRYIESLFMFNGLNHAHS